jgi:hypothetical protein
MVAVFRADDGESQAIGDTCTNQGACPAVDTIRHVVPTG